MDTMNCGTGENFGDIDRSREKKKKKEKRREKKPKSKKSKKRKRKHRSSDSESEDTRDSKKFKKSRQKKSAQDLATGVADEESTAMPGPSIPRGLLAEQAKSRAPMTKEEWEKSQSVIRRVHDESTGRTRLIRGDGEILEEIVSKDRHRNINKQATAGDGAYFQSKLQIDRTWEHE